MILPGALIHSLAIFYHVRDIVLCHQEDYNWQDWPRNVTLHFAATEEKFLTNVLLIDCLPTRTRTRTITEWSFNENFIWLERDNRSLRDVNNQLRLDSNVLIASTLDNNDILLREHYAIKSKILLSNDLAIFRQSENSIIFTSPTEIWERRSDLHGINLTNCAVRYPPLSYIESGFMVDIVLDMAKWTNFTIETIKPNDKEFGALKMHPSMIITYS